MMRLGCLQTEALMHRRAAGLRASEALQLEEHLASCRQCSEQAQMLDGMRSLVSKFGAPLDSPARTRAITTALATAQRPTRTSALAPRRILWPLAAAAAAGAVALLATQHADTPVTPAGNAAHAVAGGVVKAIANDAVATGDRVLGGEVVVNAAAQTPGTVVGSGAELHSAAGGTVALAHATVELRANTTVRWDAAERVLNLRTGSVLAEVDPSLHQSFAVRTERFSVIVLGTRFTVAERSVSVERGRVRVLDPSGGQLALLEAGQRFDLDAELDVSVSEQATAQLAQPGGAQRARLRIDATALLDRARSEIAGRRVGDARRTLDSVLQHNLPPATHAEALSLRADCALVEGDKAAAAATYQRVAERFPALPAGENALFAAARLHGERGNGAMAAQLWSRYLKRYPGGRFVKEAKTRLRDLGVSTDPAP